MLEPDPAGGELVDRPLDVIDKEVQDRERRRHMVGLGVDHDPRPGPEADLKTGRDVGATHAQGRVGHLEPEDAAVELLRPRHVVHGKLGKAVASFNIWHPPSLAGSPSPAGNAARSPQAGRAVSCTVPRTGPGARSSTPGRGHPQRNSHPTGHDQPPGPSRLAPAAPVPTAASHTPRPCTPPPAASRPRTNDHNPRLEY